MPLGTRLDEGGALDARRIQQRWQELQRSGQHPEALLPTPPIH